MFLKISLANYDETMLFAIMTCSVIMDKLQHFIEQKYNLIKTSKYLDFTFIFRFDVTVKAGQVYIESVNKLGKELWLID